MYLGAHVHDYERMFDVIPEAYDPKNKQKAMWEYGRSERRTRNMRATTHIVTGSPGSVEYHDGFYGT